MSKSGRDLQVSVAEQANADARYRATFHQAAIGIVHSAPDGSLIEANPAFCAMLGYGRREMLRMRLSDVLLADAMSGERDGSRVSGKTKLHSRTERYRHKDGSVVWAHRTVSFASEVAGDSYVVHFI